MSCPICGHSMQPVIVNGKFITVCPRCNSVKKDIAMLEEALRKTNIDKNVKSSYKDK